jgi:hypothetical protein
VRKSKYANGPPPQDLSCIVRNHHFRFIANADCTDKEILKSTLLSLLLMNLSSTNVNVRIIQAMRVTRVQVWGVPDNTAGDVTSSAVTFCDSAFGTDLKFIHTISVNQDKPAYVDARPRKGSPCDQWFNQGVTETDQFMTLQMPQNSVIDLQCDIQVAGLLTASGAILTNASYNTTNNGTLCQLYWHALDGSANVLRPPTGMSTIT